MNKIVRVLLVLFAVVAFYTIFYWIIFGIIWIIIGQAALGNVVYILANIVAGLFAAVAGIYSWKQLGKRLVNTRYYALKTGFIAGFVFFIVGFFGPIVLYPQNNLGPLWGFILCPIGFIIGLILGLIMNANNLKKSKVTVPGSDLK